MNGMGAGEAEAGCGAGITKDRSTHPLRNSPPVSFILKSNEYKMACRGDRHAAIYTGLHYLGIFVS